MKTIVSLLAGGVLFGVCVARADSIREGGRLHDNVYIVTSKQYYHVHYPDEGRIEKISRARRDVEAPKLDADPKVREALKARYDARRAEIEGEAERAKSTTVELDMDAFLQKKALIDRAVFDTQLAHWRTLTPEQQGQLLDEVLSNSASKSARRQGEKTTIQSRLESLDAERADHEEKVANAEAKREAAVEDAERYNATDFYERMHEREVVEYERGNSSYISDVWIKGADTEMALEARRKAAADNAYVKEAGAHEVALNEVEGAITQQERDAMAVENKGKEAERRFGGYLARIDALILASREAHEPALEFTPVDSWSGTEDRRTSPIQIDSAVWRLDCQRADFGTDDSFAITVFDAATNAPFTRIPGKDFLGMRMRIFDQPGTYYFVVEQAGSTIPYELTVSAVSAK